MVKGRAPDDFGWRAKASEPRVLTSWWAWGGAGYRGRGRGKSRTQLGRRCPELFVSRELDVPLGEFVFEICGRISIQGH